jgi:hypothetical protein
MPAHRADGLIALDSETQSRSPENLMKQKRLIVRRYYISKFWCGSVVTDGGQFSPCVLIFCDTVKLQQLKRTFPQPIGHDASLADAPSFREHLRSSSRGDLVCPAAVAALAA